MSIRVLIADDSPTVVELLREVISSDPQFEVAGTAGNGVAAVELCRTLRPDVITMDMMMPTMTGLEATEEIMAYCPTPILVVSSSFNRGEIFKTYDALTAGALDVLEKPTGAEPEGEWERRLLSALRVISRIRVITHLKARHKTNVRPDSQAARPSSAGAVKVITIGASTGGPAAAVEVIRALPTDLQVPVLLVLHLNAQFGRAFADWLATQSPWSARFVRDGEVLDDGCGIVLLAPPGRHLVLRGGELRLIDTPERHSCRPSIDVLFESLAAEMGPSIAATLLTGMGRDGAAGLLAIRRAGGETIAQDEATSVVYGMPREAAAIGGAKQILPLDEIGPALARIVRPAWAPA
jgi:two-component system chemotaxis response regulator CheB